MTEPLIFTTLGNVPASTLEYRVSWIDNSDIQQSIQTIGGVMHVAAENEGSITMLEEYFDIATGDCVKSSPHVYLFKGIDADSQQGAIA